MTRIFFSLHAALLVLLVAGGANAEPLSTEAALEERVLGKADAPITIIEYASLTCPHCATFHQETLPKVKSEWIETGKAKLVYRDFPTSPVGVSFAASMLARCAPQDQYFAFLSALFQTQKNWATNPDPVGALAKVAQLGGMSRADVDKCLENEALLDGIRDRAMDGKLEFDIESTPSFVVNGRVIKGGMAYDDFADILKQAEK